jgi:hypothetical protein
MLGHNLSHKQTGLIVELELTNWLGNPKIRVGHSRLGVGGVN